MYEEVAQPSGSPSTSALARLFSPLYHTIFTNEQQDQPPPGSLLRHRHQQADPSLSSSRLAPPPPARGTLDGTAVASLWRQQREQRQGRCMAAGRSTAASRWRSARRPGRSASRRAAIHLIVVHGHSISWRVLAFGGFSPFFFMFLVLRCSWLDSSC
uniref:Uncharacterized protein n=1 Tax=Arundo donax TaxID=35708 RepID=A0A0A9HDC5_ARUDO